jgi:hypothetical protein
VQEAALQLGPLCSRPPLTPGIAGRDGDGEFVEKAAKFGAVDHFEEQHRK